MPATKLIYGVGRVPKASEFSLGEIIVNVDDSKVYSKNKNNTVFELGTGASGGGGFTTASISASGTFTFEDSPLLAFSGSTGIVVTTNANNHIVITATGEAIAENAITASYAHTASYVESTNIDGTLFTTSDGSVQGEITFSDNDIEVGDSFTATALSLGTTSKPLFAAITASGDISASGLLFASASEETSGGDNIRTVVYDTASGQFYFTGSYGAGTDITEGDANRVLFYNSSGQLDSSSYLYFGNFEAPGVNEGYRELRVGIGAGGRVNSYAGKFNHISSSIYRHNNAPIEINSNFSRIAFGGNKIDFRTFGEGFDYKGPRMSLTNTELRIGSHSNDAFGAFDELSPVDVIVTGSINTTNYLRLDATGSNTVVSAIAGALIYSSSNEFYLGFS